MVADANFVKNTENKAKAVATFFCWQKTDLSKNLFTRYWRDVHAIWAARTPGFYQYRQLHLDKVDPALLSDLEGIETNLPQEDQPDGMAHISYSSSFIANLLRKPFALKQADEDNAIFVSKNTYQRSVLPFSQTFVDRTNHPDINGSLQKLRFVLAFKRNAEVSTEEFRSYLNHNLCDAWGKRQEVQRLRLEVLQPHENLPNSPKGVVQTWDRGKQYQAWIELGLSEGSSLRSMFTSLPDLQKHISAVHAYPVREMYTIVFDGKPTLVGLRGYQAAQTIAEAGADFQKSKEVLKFTYGAAINGGRLIPQSIYVALVSVVIIGILLFLQFS
ncbi:MAG: hypothetical protein HRU41_10165 [Saprospiraceae bacterium]|nr:hypothetical protein [Saprospiraceae bacterium]